MSALAIGSQTLELEAVDRFIMERLESDDALSALLGGGDAGRYDLRIKSLSPLAYWRLGEPPGATQVIDQSGNGYHGAPLDGFTLGVAGALVGDGDTAFQSDGLTGRVNVPGPGFQPDYSAMKYTGGELSLECWFRRDVDDLTNPTAWFFSKPWNSSGGYNYRLGLQSGAKIQVYVGGASNEVFTADATIPREAWTHSVLTLDSAKNVDLFVGGELVHHWVHTITDWVPSGGDNNTALCLGNVYPYPAPWAGNASMNFFGRLDEQAMYPYKLTPEQIRRNFQVGQKTLGQGPRIWNAEAPEGEDMPMVVFQCQDEGDDALAVGAHRVMARPMYVVRGIADQSDFGGDLYTIANRIDAVLHRAQGAVPSIAGSRVAMWRIRPFTLTESPAVRHRGAMFRVLAYVSA